MGRVVDRNGNPLAGVTVRAATGIGTLHGGGGGVTDADGRYDFCFGMGITFAGENGKPSPQTQYALISAHLDGHFEKNFNRHGSGIASLQPVSAQDATKWGVEPLQVGLPDKPREVNCVMLPAARVAGTLVGEEDEPLKGYSVSLTADELPPGHSVLAQAYTDEHGRFKITEIPTSIPYQFKVRKPRSELRPPWDDSWASGPITLADPGDNELRTSIKSAQDSTVPLPVMAMRLKIVGPGVHGKSAVTKDAQRKLSFPSDEGSVSATEITLNELTLMLDNEDVAPVKRRDGSVRGAAGNGGPYRDPRRFPERSTD